MNRRDHLLALLALAGTGPLGPRNAFAQDVLPSERPFYLGMTPHPHDFTAQAFADTYKLLAKHVDLVAHHMDEGVPWEEALEGRPFDANVETDIKRRIDSTPAGKKVFLSVTPVSIERNGIAGVWAKDSHMKRPAALATRAFNDPDIVRGYIAYCRRMIERFKPDYMAYAIEISDLIKTSVALHNAFVALSREVYAKLKQEYPALPLFPTFVLGNDESLDAAQKQVMRDLAPYTDIVAVSTYPYVWDGVGGDPKSMGTTWFEKVAKVLPDKPFAVAETGFIAKTFSLLRYLVYIPSSEDAQAEYVRLLLADAARLKAEFVVWYVPRDYDLLWAKMKKAGASPWFEQWRTSGLYDAQGRGRKALGVWDQWLRLPKK